MGPINVVNALPYLVMRGTCDIEILARCRGWDDAIKIAERHPNARIYNEENDTYYYRSERTVIEYMAKEE